jgi:hypothetical protein
MPGLLFPLALVALVSVVLPLVIHLARRDQQRPTLFAALAWLRQKPKPQQRQRFDEWPLLITRLLLLTLLALFLARPVLFHNVDTSAYVVVVPGVDLAQVKTESGRKHWLSPGFPSLDAPAPKGALPVSSLLRQLDAELPAGAKLTVYVPAQLQGIDAERLNLSRSIDWRIVPGVMWPQAAAMPPPPSLTVRYAPGHENGVRYLRAAAVAWQTPFAAGPVTEPIPANANANAKVLVWLAPGALPASVKDWQKRGGVLLTAAETTTEGEKIAYWRDETGVALIEGKGRYLRFARSLTPAAMPQLLDPDFPQHLQAALTGLGPQPSIVSAQAYAPQKGANAFVQAARDFQPWLAVLIALLVIVERWLATSRRRGVAP